MSWNNFAHSKKPPCATTCRLHDRYNLVRRWHLGRDIHRYASWESATAPEPGGALWPDNWTKPPPAKLLLHSQKKGRYQFLILWTWCWCLRQVFDQATRQLLELDPAERLNVGEPAPMGLLSHQWSILKETQITLLNVTKAKPVKWWWK